MDIDENDLFFEMAIYTGKPPNLMSLELRFADLGLEDNTINAMIGKVARCFNVDVSSYQWKLTDTMADLLNVLRK